MEQDYELDDDYEAVEDSTIFSHDDLTIDSINDIVSQVQLGRRDADSAIEEINYILDAYYEKYQ